MNKKRIICWSLFISYVFFILWMTVLKREATEREYELGLFWGLRMWLKNEPNGLAVLIQYIKNILFFIPFGYLMCETSNIKWKSVLLVGIITSLSVEITQYELPED